MRTFLCCVAMLAGCAGQPQIPAVTKVPVPVSCLKEAPPPKPSTAEESTILAMTDYAATVTTWTERLTLKAYAEKADALLKACAP